MGSGFVYLRGNGGKYGRSGMKIRDRIKELRRVKASELHPNPKNWRTHPREQLDAIRGILSEVGFAGAELARELPDGSLQLIDGHARAEIAGDSEVPVLILDVTEAEADKILATYDPLSSMAEVNSTALDNLLRGVQTSSQALADMLTKLHDENVKELTENTAVGDDGEKLDKAIQLEPGKEYIIVMAANDEEWEEMRSILSLGLVRRGGYKHGSAFDSVGTQRVLHWESVRELLQ